MCVCVREREREGGRERQREKHIFLYQSDLDVFQFYWTEEKKCNSFFFSFLNPVLR